MVNSPNSPGFTAAAGVVATQSIWLTTSVTVPSSVWRGWERRFVVTFDLQPGFCPTVTLGIGVAGGVGNAIWILVTVAPVSSFGTMNESFALPPWGAVGGSMVTCAAAGVAIAHTIAPAKADARTIRLFIRCSYRMSTVASTTTSLNWSRSARMTKCHLPENGIANLSLQVTVEATWAGGPLQARK